MHRPHTLAVLAALVAVPVLVPSAGAAAPRRFHNCAALNRVYPHGVAKSFAVLKTADGFTERPFVSSAEYAANPKTLDRDHDGVECES